MKDNYDEYTEIWKKLLKSKDNYYDEYTEQTLVCCATCHYKSCRDLPVNPISKECLDVNNTMNSILFWSEETGYLPKLNKEYPYIHWKGKPEFIKKEEMFIE